MEAISKNKKQFNDFRFDGLNAVQISNKYLTMKRVSDDENKIVVKVALSHLKSTQYGWMLILDNKHVVFLKPWQVNINYYGNEVLLDRNYFNVKEFGEWDEFIEEPQNLNFDTWLNAAKDQESYLDEDGCQLNKVQWRF